MACNTTQNEIGGKELLLKACVLIENVTTANTSSDITKTAHGLKVGDLVKFLSVGTLTAVTVNTFYFVKEVTANTFKISATRAGVAIVMDAVESTLDIDAYKSFGGIRSKSFSFSAEGVDITNQDSDEWSVMLNGAGMRSVSVSGSGVYTNETTFQAVLTKFLANELTCLMLIETKTDRVFEGCFKITSLEVGGDYNAESNFSVSAESSGPINVISLA